MRLEIEGDVIGSTPGSSTRRVARHMTDSENEKELTKLSTVERFHTAARLRELEAEATTPWVKQYLRSLIEERERMAGEQEASGFSLR
jgi:hypothetical protein